MLRTLSLTDNQFILCNTLDHVPPQPVPPNIQLFVTTHPTIYLVRFTHKHPRRYRCIPPLHRPTSNTGDQLRTTCFQAWRIYRRATVVLEETDHDSNGSIWWGGHHRFVQY